MTVTVIWHSLIKPEHQSEGLRLTRQIWEDMRSFSGYAGHEILVNVDDPCHIIQIGRWQTREDADSVRDKYKDSPVIAALTPILQKPRDRWITKTDHV